MVNCKNCKHWDMIKINPSYGFCEAISYGCDDSPMARILDSSILKTREDFGCLLFESKQDD